MKTIYPLLTVLMPVYNAEKFLDESINSILSQTYSEFEFLILDDASTDNSLKIIKAYAREDKRIKVFVNQKNQQEAKCRNILLKNSKTEFIAWMDADDISLPVKLQTQIDFFKKNPTIDIVSAYSSIFGDSEGFIRQPLLDIQIKSTFLFNCAVVSSCAMVKMKKIRENKIFYNEKLKSAADFQYWVDCCSFMRFANINRVLYNYRIHPSQDSTANKKIQKKMAVKIVKKHLSKLGIKVDKKTEDIVLRGAGKLDKESFKKIVSSLFSIKDFYGYSGIDKKIAFNYFCQYMQPHWMQSVTEYSLKLASIPLRQLCFSELSVLDYFRVFLIKITRRLFYIKKFGILNYIKTRF